MLPLDIRRVLLRQRLNNPQAGLNGRKRTGQVTLGLPHGADPRPDDRDPVLQPGIGRFLLHQPQEDVQPSLIQI